VSVGRGGAKETCFLHVVAKSLYLTYTRQWSKSGVGGVMDVFLRLQIQIRLHARLSRCTGQTMAEYALILAAIAAIAYAGYHHLGLTILNGPLDEVRELLS
jgi:hypothetical protein